ncbi:Uncharacterised protein [uncultured archaeon]|nr:Uncharacterised protein [uncultured archaeon]
MIKKMLKKLIPLAAAAGLAAQSLSGQSLEEKIKNENAAAQNTPKVELLTNYEAISQNKTSNYNIVYNMPGSDSFKPIKPILMSILKRELNSYSSLIESIKNLSEKEKITLLSAVSGLCYRGCYNTELTDAELESQEMFFNRLQNSLSTGEDDAFGVCKQISSHIEKLAKDIGFKSATVSGLSDSKAGHTYNLIKTNDGLVLIDGYSTLFADTKNIEEILNSYQDNLNSPTFQHLFFEGGKFKSRIINQEGRNFIDFVEYDESLNKLKESLLTNKKDFADLKLSFNQKDDLISLKIDGKNFFGGVGYTINELNGNNLFLAKIGNTERISFLKDCSLDSKTSLVYGNM